MMTNEDKNEIVKEVIEKVLTLMPDVIGNLMESLAKRNKFKQEVFEKYPEFKGHEDVVASVIEMEEGKDMSVDIFDSVDTLLPRVQSEIKNRIHLKSTLNMDKLREKRELPLALPQDESINGIL